ncbi:hypothetical protein PT974_11382 [Cladobotryum mycophilum]|uniref:Uncharacterized protein n=1 Tax=Cladobotryum mycophilum TaxID=491253 RepID=A0ABR0S522_9HYPO
MDAAHDYDHDDFSNNNLILTLILIFILITITMAPQCPSSTGVSGPNGMLLPPAPPMIDALPILAGEESDCEDSMQAPRCLPARQQYEHNTVRMDILSRRLSRHTLIQQIYQSNTTSSLPQIPSLPPTKSSTSISKLPCLGSANMEIDSDDGYAAPDPSILSATRFRRSRRDNSKSVAPKAPETKIDSSVAARVLERMQKNAVTTSDDAKPALPRLATLPDIEIDTTDKMTDLEADEGYAAADGDLAWLEQELPSEATLAGALKSRGVLRFNTSAETALRCPKLVKNVPRMRKRQQKKKEHRLKIAAAANGESSRCFGITASPALQHVR